MSRKINGEGGPNSTHPCNFYSLGEGWIIISSPLVIKLEAATPIPLFDEQNSFHPQQQMLLIYYGFSPHFSLEPLTFRCRNAKPIDRSH